jgi:O-antigen ligase
MINRILGNYCKTMGLFFYVFLFGTLSFGRAFSILHVNTPLGPLFATEIFLLLSIPVLLFKYKNLAKLPKTFLVFLLPFFSFGCILLLNGLIYGNLFALRDITLCGYILFLPITMIYLNNTDKIKAFIAVIILSNIISLYSGWCVLKGAYFSEAFRNFIPQGRLFNWGLYYGMAISFIISFYKSIKPRLYRLAALILLSVNIYMLFMNYQRSLWIAVLSLFVFFSLTLKKNFLKPFLFFIPLVIAISLITSYSGFKTVPSSATVVSDKAKGFGLFLKGVPYHYNSAEASSAKESPEVEALGNIAFRLNIWKETLEFCSDSPLIGKGFGVYPAYSIWGIPRYPKGLYLDSKIIPVHNHVLTIFLKMGILGSVLFLAINN